MQNKFYTQSIFFLTLISISLLTLKCDDSSIVSSTRDFTTSDTSVVVRIQKNTHQSSNLTMNLKVIGLAPSDVVDPKLTANTPINIFSVDEQEFIPQDTVFFAQYGDQSESVFEAQIRYNTDADSGLITLDLNGQQVLSSYIYLFGGPILKELPLEKVVSR